MLSPKYSAMKVAFQEPYRRGGRATSLLACMGITIAEKLVNNSKVFLVNYVYP